LARLTPLETTQDLYYDVTAVWWSEFHVRSGMQRHQIASMAVCFNFKKMYGWIIKRGVGKKSVFYSQKVITMVLADENYKNQDIRIHDVYILIYI